MKREGVPKIVEVKKVTGNWSEDETRMPNEEFSIEHLWNVSLPRKHAGEDTLLNGPRGSVGWTIYPSFFYSYALFIREYLL
ncbi:MAG TPA: hypothetical protein VL087_09360 [Nitrospirota bacterium]|nr:hypothetical protein [Nitrospirota bacterium]